MKKELSFKHTNTIVNLSNSLLKHYGIKNFHETIPEIDNVLKGHKKVAILLFDGMGSYLINKHLLKNSFIRQHLFCRIESTFPSTTVASTNGLLTGLFPIENGWFGWRQYFKEYDCPVLVFMDTNALDGSSLPYKGNGIKDNFYHVPTIFDLIKEKNKNIDVFDIKQFPIQTDGPHNLFDSKAIINEKLKSSKSCFLYHYYERPDSLIHIDGVDGVKTHNSILEINDFVTNIVNDNPDTLFIVLSDHGLINTSFLCLYEHPDFSSLFLHEPTFEGRATNFFVKRNSKRLFKQLFNQYYHKYGFILLSRDEVLKMHVFGPNDGNEKTRSFIGDFLSISTGKYSFKFREKSTFSSSEIVAHHAGYTEREKSIDICVFLPKTIVR